MTDLTFPTDAAMLAAFEAILDQLDSERRTSDLTDKAEQAYWRSQHHAFAKAYSNYRAGVRPDYTGASYLISSATRPIVHRVRRAGDIWLCSCEATALCWHAATVATVERAIDLIEHELIGSSFVPPDQPPDDFQDVGPIEPEATTTTTTTTTAPLDEATARAFIDRLAAARRAKLAA